MSKQQIDSEAVLDWLFENFGGKIEMEYRFHPTRMWRFDFAWPEEKIGLEIEGGVFTGGAHVRKTGYHKDMQKYNEAARIGYKVFRFLPSEFTNGTVLDYMRKVFDE